MPSTRWYGTRRAGRGRGEGSRLGPRHRARCGRRRSRSGLRGEVHEGGLLEELRACGLKEVSSVDREMNEGFEVEMQDGSLTELLQLITQVEG